jgi:predicted protein tyrosine phosphatase
MNVLFVCTLNKVRSVCAERLYRRTPGISVRSAGISDRAAHHVTREDLEWAHKVIVFTPGHEQWLRAAFAGDLPPIVDIGVPDQFATEGPRLAVELAEALTPILGPPGP